MAKTQNCIIEFKATVWLYKGSTAWHFVTLPKEQSDKVRYLSMNKRAAWGSVRVSVTIGDSTWQTSLFPSKELGSYILPIKSAIRTAEKIKADKTINISLIIQ